jgi:hypothetical protein
VERTPLGAETPSTHLRRMPRLPQEGLQRVRELAARYFPVPTLLPVRDPPSY